MSDTKQITDFAKMILNHPMKDAVMDRITISMMERFRKGSAIERDEISRITDSMDLFFTELQVIVSETQDVNEVTDKPGVNQ